MFCKQSSVLYHPIPTSATLLKSIKFHSGNQTAPDPQYVKGKLCSRSCSQRARTEKRFPWHPPPPPPAGKTHHRRGKTFKAKSRRTSMKMQYFKPETGHNCSPSVLHPSVRRRRKKTLKRNQRQTPISFTLRNMIFSFPLSFWVCIFHGVSFPGKNKAAAVMVTRSGRFPSRGKSAVAREISYRWLSGHPSRHKLE